MNHRHLSFVLSVAQHGSFSAAAAACNVTQPTLSAGIRQIEQHLGARLFDRSTRHVALTAFGRDIIASIRDVVTSEIALRTQAKALIEPRGKLVRIGVSPIVEVSRIVKLMASYREQFPTVDVVYKECFVDDLETRLLTDQIDIAIWPATATGNDDLVSVGLYDEPWIYLPNASDANAFGSAPQCVSEFAEHPLILTSGYCGLSQATQSMFEDMELQLNVYPGRAISYSAIEEWADLGLGAALLPASKVSRARKGRAIPVLNEDRSAAKLNVVASWRPDQSPPLHLSPLLSFFSGTDNCQF